MSLGKIKSNLKIYLFTFIVLLASLYFASYKIFNSYFSTIETSQNTKAITHFINNVNDSIDDVKGVVLDYSNWDETYDFIDGLNDPYIYNNFRQGTNSLKDLKLDFMIFTKKSNKILFSKYVESFSANKQVFEKHFFKILNNHENAGTIVSVNNEHFIVVKNPINESDGKSNSNGYIYSGKKIDVEYLRSLTPVYQEIIILNKRLNKFDNAYPRKFLKSIKLQTKYTPSKIINNIQLEDINNTYLFTIEAIFSRDIVASGKGIIILFNIFITILLGLVFYLVIKQQQNLIKQNLKLDTQVTEKTLKLNQTLKKLEKKNKELFHLANTDALTNISNRRNFFEKSKKAINKIKISKQELSVLMIDLDKFKSLNDKYGHKIGDLILIEFCKIVNSIIEKNAIFGRLGGEEFAITFPNKNIIETEKISEKIRKKIENYKFEKDSTTIQFTASFGLATYEKNLTIDDILCQADELLYKAKKEGRNRVIRKKTSS